MARKRFRSSQRHEPVTERSFQEYLYSTAAPQTSRTELMRLVRGGEDTFLELKVKLSNPEKVAQEIVALANTGGGVIVFGVNDQLRIEGIEDGENVQDELVRICREEIVPPIIPFIDRIAFDNGRRIMALDVNGKRRPYRTRDGRFFIRIGADKREASPEELSTLLDDSLPLLYENVPALRATLADIDEAHLWSFMRGFAGGAFDVASVKDYPTADILEKYLMLATNNHDDIVPTVAGLLLFGRDERVADLLPRAAMIASRFGFQYVGWREYIGFMALLVGHVVICMPFAVRTVSISLHTLPPNVELAAASLGATRWRTLQHVVLPLIKTGVVAGAVFAFIHSFTDVNLSIFLARPGEVPITVKILGFLEFGFAPTLAAVSVITLLLPLILVAIVERVSGLGDFIYGDHRRG